MSLWTKWPRVSLVSSKSSSHSTFVTTTCPPEMSQTKQGVSRGSCICSTLPMSNFPWWMQASRVSELKAPGVETKFALFLARGSRRAGFMARARLSSTLSMPSRGNSVGLGSGSPSIVLGGSTPDGLGSLKAAVAGWGIRRTSWKMAAAGEQGVPQPLLERSWQPPRPLRLPKTWAESWAPRFWSLARPEKLPMPWALRPEVLPRPWSQGMPVLPRPIELAWLGGPLPRQLPRPGAQPRASDVAGRCPA
mmetsp:Transcript_82788/g.251005  ORF Transcript_82788/g.251005 Transcript_82788/m.251005 type:complete len:249 (+) Transcript_82788:375-1121(+)